jgi:hypothetical protein
LFLVMLVPFTVNGIGVREAFFISFLGAGYPRPGVACGFLFFLLTICSRCRRRIVLWENVVARRTGAVPDGTLTSCRRRHLQRALGSTRCGRVDNGSTDGTVPFVRGASGGASSSSRRTAAWAAATTWHARRRRALLLPAELRRMVPATGSTNRALRG